MPIIFLYFDVLIINNRAFSLVLATLLSRKPAKLLTVSFPAIFTRVVGGGRCKNLNLKYL